MIDPKKTKGYAAMICLEACAMCAEDITTEEFAKRVETILLIHATDVFVHPAKKELLQ